MPQLVDLEMPNDVPRMAVESNRGYQAPDNHKTLPLRPSIVEPIFDALTASKSLAPFDGSLYSNSFGVSTRLDSETFVPQRPDSFTDAYLEPTLTKNEHMRLAALWYYTESVQEDQQILGRLDRIINLVKQSFSWELGIVGIMDATTYTRLATVNLPLAILPRSECTCAHTVNQKSGTVLTLQDLSQDWRFQHSPHVEFGGLRSYAAAQIRLVQEGAEDVVFGTLCVASMNIQNALTEEQKKTLISAADLVAGEIVAWKQARRFQDRQTMQADLDKLRGVDAHADATIAVLKIVRQRYPSADVNLVDAAYDAVQIGSGLSIPLDCVKNGIWENTEILTSLRNTVLPGPLVTETPVRAVIGHITTNQRLLVVSSSNMKEVLDETDAWFVDQCAQIVNLAEQKRIAREALSAKDRLLRSITHELRTPIHGILSSVELLEEELGISDLRADGLDPPHSFLQIIRQSGTQLMTTVNDILRLNSSIEHSAPSPVSNYDLRYLEEDVLGQVLANYSEAQLRALSIRFSMKFAGRGTVVTVDADLLKELVKCLVFNAISATPSGIVEINSTLLSDENLLKIDVVDTGCGIREIDGERIFQAFEKLDLTSRGVGVGLNLAMSMATRLKGKVSLLSSRVGKGSHFQIELPHILITSPSPSLLRGLSQKSRTYSHSYYLAGELGTDVHLLSHVEQHLSKQGMTRSGTAQGSLIVFGQPDPSTELLNEQLGPLVGPHLILHVAASPNPERIKDFLSDKQYPHLSRCITGPLYNIRLNLLLDDAESAFEQLCSSLQLQGRDVESRKQKDLANSSQPFLSSTTPPPTPSPEIENPLSSFCVPRPLRTLLVDDNNVNLAVLKSFCKKRRIAHGTAINGNRAVSAYLEALSSPNGSDSFTLVMMDLQMPECDGVEAVRQIRRIEAQHKLTPSTILMITGQDSVTDRNNSFQAGVDGFYVKPVSMKTLDQVIAEYFPRKQNSHE